MSYGATLSDWSSSSPIASVETSSLVLFFGISTPMRTTPAAFGAPQRASFAARSIAATNSAGVAAFAYPRAGVEERESPVEG